MVPDRLPGQIMSKQLPCLCFQGASTPKGVTKSAPGNQPEAPFVETIFIFLIHDRCRGAFKAANQEGSS